MQTGWREQYYRYKGFFLDMVALYNRRRDIRAFLEVILSLATIIIFIAFALRPTALTIISLYNQIQEKQKTLNSLTQKIRDLQTANAVFNQNQNFISDIDNAIFTNPEPDTVSEQILGLASKDGVSVLGISVGQVAFVGKSIVQRTTSDVQPLPNNTLSMPLSISTRGAYSNTLTFIKDVENLRIPIKIDSLSINSSQTQSGNAIVGVITARVPFIGH